MNLNIGGEYSKKIIDAKTSTASTPVNANNSQQTISFKTNNNTFLKEFNLTQEQFNILQEKYPDIYNLAPEKIINIIQNEFQTQKTEITETEPSVETKSNQVEAKQFNHAEFSKLPLEEKFSLYAAELAKNKFIYGQGESSEKWESLSEQEKQNLINTEIKNLKKENSSSYNKDPKQIEIYFSGKMTKLQTANSLNMNIEVFESMPELDRKDAIHQYISGLDNNNKTKAQIIMAEVNLKLSQLVIEACKEKGLTEYEHLWNSDTTSYNFEPSEMAHILNELGTTKVQLSQEALQKKIDKGIATEKEKEEFKILTQLANLEKSKNDINYGRLDTFKESKFGKDFETCTSPEDKLLVINNYMLEKCSKLPKEEQTKFYDEMLNDLVNSGDTEIALALKGIQIKNAKTEDQKHIAAHLGSKVDAALTSIQVNEFGDNIEALDCLEERQRKLAKEDKEFGNRLAHYSLENANNRQRMHLSSRYADKEKWDATVQQKVVDTAYECNDVKTQKVMLSNTADKSETSVKINAATQLDKAYKENQIELTEEFVQDKDVNNAMIEDGTFSRYAVENQKEAFKIHKTRCEQNDYDDQTAINYLNKLANQIQNCDEKNQLAMHEEIMTSKYTEVQENAAANIKNYKPSVQEKAMESVYKSGNEKAINKLIQDTADEKNFPALRNEALKMASDWAMTTANTSDELNKKFLNGNLTLQEVKNLPSSERRKYIDKYFNKLGSTEKIKFLKEHITTSAQKKVVYTTIARNNSTLFNEICKDKDMVELLLNLGLPQDVNKEIENIVSFIAIADVGFQEICKQHDIEYDGMDKKLAENNKKYTTDPFAKEQYELFPKKQGDLIG